MSFTAHRPARTEAVSAASRGTAPVLAAAGLAVDAYLHAHLADRYDAITSMLSQGTLFRVEAALAALAALLVLLWRRPPGTSSPRAVAVDDAVIVGSGVATREVAEDPEIMNVLRGLDPSRQLIAAQCSGALVLARLGLLDDVPACTDLTTKPWVVAAGVEVLNQPFHARDDIATAAAVWPRTISPPGSSPVSGATTPPRARCTTSPRSVRRRSTSSAPGATSPPTWPLPPRPSSDQRQEALDGAPPVCPRRAPGGPARPAHGGGSQRAARLGSRGGGLLGTANRSCAWRSGFSRRARRPSGAVGRRNSGIRTTVAPISTARVGRARSAGSASEPPLSEGAGHHREEQRGAGHHRAGPAQAGRPRPPGRRRSAPRPRASGPGRSARVRPAGRRCY
ncbi:hypothetical protein STENM327S_04073 [Streptomyces tendae]